VPVQVRHRRREETAGRRLLTASEGRAAAKPRGGVALGAPATNGGDWEARGGVGSAVVESGRRGEARLGLI
jgi:hypothetical protein